MLSTPDTSEPGTLRAVRRLLLIVLTIGLVGTAIDLLLLAHYEDAWQRLPLVLIAVGLASVAALVVRSNRGTVTALRLTMLLFLAAGAAGVYLHYSGNREFQHELDPSLSGWALFATIMTAKAPPAMAPGVMVLLGLIGLVFTYRHPASSRSRAQK